jgi:hypothetical protein
MLAANIEEAQYIENLPGRKFLLGRDFGGNHPPSAGAENVLARE